ncbi:MAG: hypothetical protein L3V56_11830 [Candidatus Magnetoovum sp. WYHC-5]|nr:hypothetical protein [Candidatus Magnetoovum sp. WYHC-5]
MFSHFKHIDRLERQNDRLMSLMFELIKDRRSKHDNKIINRDIPFSLGNCDMDIDRKKDKEDR